MVLALGAMLYYHFHVRLNRDGRLNIRRRSPVKKAILFLIIICFVISVSPYLLNSGISSGQTAVKLKEIEPFVYVSLSHKGPFSDIEDVITDLITSMKSQNIHPTGPMIGILWRSGMCLSLAIRKPVSGIVCMLGKA